MIAGVADTHAAVWFLFGDTQLSKNAKSFFDRAAGNGNVVYTKNIEYTDFPLDSVDLWFENGTIYLPSER